MATVLLRSIDLECASIDPPEEPADGVIEVGFTDLWLDTETKAVTVGDTYTSLLFNPPGGIPPESRSVHHIGPADVAGEGPASPAILSAVEENDRPFALVSFNAKFEQAWLSKYLPTDVRWLCVYKAVLRLFPDWSGHGNQMSRYMLGLELDPAQAMPPHRAGPDSYVTAHVLAELLRRGASVRDMLAWTKEPRWMTRCPLGKHKGQPWSDVPADYLAWLGRTEDMDPDVKHWARVELERRRDLSIGERPGSEDYA